MIRRENIIKRFTLGISVLTAYIHYMGSLNMHDINISSEQFICDLLNILYNVDLKNANNNSFNNVGYDLISETKRKIVQVTSTDKPDKIINTINVIENNIQERREKLYRLKEINYIKKENLEKYTDKLKEDCKKLKNDLSKQKSIECYSLYFFVMVENAEKTKNYKGKNGAGYLIKENIVFDKEVNILDFTSLIRKANSISENSDGDSTDVLNSLENFMNKNNSIFGSFTNECKCICNRVETVIKEYSDNFTEKLFRHKYISDSRVTLDRLFVNPRIYENGSDNADMVKVLSNFLWDETENRILFIEGDAAIGKTSVISYLCYHYLNDDEVCKTIFLQNQLVCIRLRELDFSDKNKKIDKIILDYLNIERIEELRSQYPNCILIMDGADEMSMIEGIHKGKLEELIIAIRKTFKNNKIIITTRPQFIDEKAFDGRSFGVKTIKLLHFDDKTRNEWMKKYEECGEYIPDSTKNYIKNLDEQTAIGVADTPLALYLLVACDMSHKLQDNIWALYHEIFNNAIVNTEYNENFDNNLEHPIKQYEKLLYNVVCKIAYRMFQNSEEERYYITSYELDEIIEEQNLESEIIDGIKKCCVLCAYWKNNGHDGALEFYHNNIRDYFFAEYIFNLLIPIMDNRYENKEECFLKIMCEIMQYGRISHTTWEQTFLFIYKRIQYMGNNCDDIKKFTVIFINMYKNIILKDTIWKFCYKGFYYQKLKNTLFNTFLLIRIFMSATHSNDKCIKTRFWNSEEELALIKNSKILFDLNELFDQSIAIGKNDIISVGQNCNLDDISFEKINLSDISFKHSSLESSNFCNANLENIDFSDCNLSNTLFSGSTLLNINFSDTSLSNVDFEDCNIIACNFVNAEIDRGKFDSTKINKCCFKNCKIYEVDWEYAKVVGCSFDSAEIYHSKIKSFVLKKESVNKVWFKDCFLNKIQIDDCGLEECIFEECKIDGSKFINTHINKSIFKHVSCKNVMFNNSIISSNEIIDANFEDASLAQAKISKNKWEKLNLKNTDFRHTEIYSEDYKILKGYNANLKWAVYEQLIK